MVVWCTFHSGVIRADYYGFPIFELFNENDYRCRAYAYPFPQVLYYADGDFNPRGIDYRIVTNTPDIPLADMPKNINEILQGRAQKVHYYEAYACIIPGQSTYNYFLHTAFIPSMQQENIKFEASVGMFNTENIGEAVEGHKLFPSIFTNVRYSYHDGACLSGNVARFQISDLNKPADGWFVGICQNNAIVVHWFFFTPQSGMRIEYKGRRLPSWEDWNSTPIQEILTSTVIPEELPTIQEAADLGTYTNISNRAPLQETTDMETYTNVQCTEYQIGIDFFQGAYPNENDRSQSNQYDGWDQVFPGDSNSGSDGFFDF